MTNENITEIGIDLKGRLYIKPFKVKFTMIYRSAAEVHWDNTQLFLYSPKPREWSYFDWFKHIVSLIKTDYGCNLILTDKTRWNNIDKKLRKQMESENK